MEYNLPEGMSARRLGDMQDLYSSNTEAISIVTLKMPYNIILLI